MARIAKIAPIKKEYSSTFKTVDQQLAQNGFHRFPGATVTMLPHKEASGKYRTGLDDKALYLNKLAPEEKEAEIKRIREDKPRLEEALGLPGSGILDPTSIFYNFAASDRALRDKFGTDVKVNPVKLGTDEAIFYIDGTDAMMEITWNWLKVNPRIAPSLEAYRKREVPADIQYYIVDDEAETKQLYSKKKEINLALVAFEALSPTKKKQIARQMGLAISDDTKEEVVYNLMDTQLKEGEFKKGAHKGASPVRLFNDLIKISDGRLKVKDLVEQAIIHSVYRALPNGKITEGELTIAATKEDLVEFLLDDKNQMDLIALEKKLNNKKIK